MTDNVSYVRDIAYEHLLIREAEDRRKAHDMLRQTVNPDTARLAAANAAYYPNLGGGVIGSAAIAGLTPGSAHMDALAARQLQADVTALEPNKESTGKLWGWSAIGDAFKKFTRGLFTALEYPIQEGILHPLRTSVLNYQRGRPASEILFPFTSPAHEETGWSAEAQTFQSWFRGEPVNLGQGIFPRSELAPETEQLVMQGVPLGEAAQNPAQLELGRPVTQLAEEEAASSVQITSPGGISVPVSPGRLAAIKVFEPDTFGFNALSGVLDIGTYVVLDPSNVALAGLSKLSKLNKVLVAGSSRKTFLSRTWDEWLSSNDARRMADWLAQNQDFNKTYEFLRGTQGTVDASLAADLTRIADPTEIVNAISSAAMDGRLRKQALTPQSLLGRALRPGASGQALFTPHISALFGPKAYELGRIGGARVATRSLWQDGFLGYLAADVGATSIAVDDVSRGLWHLRENMKVARFTPEEIAEHSLEFAKLSDGDGLGMYRVMRDIAKRFKEKLIAEGYDPTAADSVVKLWRTPEEMRKYFTDAVGKPMYAGPVTRQGAVVADETLDMPTALGISEFLHKNIPLLNPRMVRSALRKANYSEIRNAAGDNIAKLDGFNEAVVTAADFAMQKVWKPAVLLRVAWPVRVIGEEQFRMAAGGLDSLFNHPLQYIGWALSKPRAFLKPKGATGVKRTLLEAAAEHSAAMSRHMDWLYRTGQKSKSANTIDGLEMIYKETGGSRFYEAMAFRLSKHVNDPLQRAVAGIRDPDGLNAVKASFWDGDLATYRQKLVSDPNPDSPWRALADQAAADEHVEYIWSYVTQATGGKGRMLQPDGTWLDLNGFRVDPPGSWSWADDMLDPGVGVIDSEFFVLDELGDTRLLDAIAGGPKGQTLLLDDGTALGAWNDLDHKTIAKWLKANAADTLPDFAYGPKLVPKEQRNLWDRTVDSLMMLLMGKPTDALSRSPAFRQFYWKRVGEMMGYATNDVREQIIKAASEAGIERGTLRGWLRGLITGEEASTLARLEEMAGEGFRLGGVLDEPLKGIDSLDHIDELAKGYALNETKRLLYDLSKRHNFFDITRNIFPFGEAWLEIMSTWARLVVDNPQLIRKMQMGVQGLRRGDPVEALTNPAEYEGKGFFYTDPSTGEEIFNYPGSELISNWMMGGAEDATRVQFTARVSGLNLFLGNFLPGVGPVVQIPTSMMGFFDDPDRQWARELILPYGDLNDENIIAAMTDSLLPAWFKKGLVAFGTVDGDDERLYNNTVIDVYKSLLYRQDGSDATPDAQSATLERAKKIAKTIYRIRALSQFVGPTGAGVRYDVKDRSGEMWAMQSLSTEYYQLLEDHNWDHNRAFDEFTRLFGLDPSLLYTSKTRSLARRSTTEPGAEWEARNPDLFAAYPLSAYYARPDDPDDPFDYPAYLRQLEEGTREPVSPEEWAQLRNDFLGRLVYEHARQQITDETGQVRSDQAARLWLRNIRYDLQERYPGYDREIMGLEARPERADVINELDQWHNSPGLMATSVGQAVATYMAARRQALARVEGEGNARSALRSAKKFAYLRAWLTQIGDQLAAQHPDFAPVWQQVLYREIEREDEIAPTELLGVSF